MPSLARGLRRTVGSQLDASLERLRPVLAEVGIDAGEPDFLEVHIMRR